MRTIPQPSITSWILRCAVVVAAISALFAAASPRPAGAAWHFANINELMVNADGNPAIQYVEIRTNTTFQNLVSGGGITVFQGAGFTIIPTLGPDLVNPNLQNRWVMASPSAAEWLAASGIATDLTFTGQLPTSNAMICWGKPSNPANPSDPGYADCLAYGGYSGSTPPPTGSPTALNAGDGQRSLTRTGNSGNDALDFAFACPTPENWATNVGSFGPCGGADTDGDQLDDAWEALYPACVTVGTNDGSADVDTPTPDGLTNFQEMNGGSDPCDTDTDNDGFCSDGEERGLSPLLGGRRNPNLPSGQYDFYDVNGSGNVNGVDIGLVRGQFNMMFPAYDRSPGPAPWAAGPPNGGNISGVEIGIVRASFNHTCVAAP